MNYLTNSLPYYERLPVDIQKKWERWFIPSMIIEWIITIPLVPIVSFFVRTEERNDRMKRRNRERGLPSYDKHTAPRQYLWHIFNWFQTNDNAQEEYFHGDYSDWLFEYFEVTEDKFNARTFAGKWWRYYARVRWGWRNKAYGFFSTVLGIKHQDTKVIFEYGVEDSGKLWVLVTQYQYQAQIPNGNGGYKSVNIGWKDLKSAYKFKDGTTNASYANRLWSPAKDY